MPRSNKRFDESVKHQAVCTRGDFFGTHHSDPEEAEREAASHTSKPGKTNHVVKIITTVKSVKNFTSR